MAIEYTIYGRIEAFDTETQDCFEPDTIVTERDLFSTNCPEKAALFLQELPTKEDDLEGKDGK